MIYPHCMVTLMVIIILAGTLTTAIIPSGYSAGKHVPASLYYKLSDEKSDFKVSKEDLEKSVSFAHGVINRMERLEVNLEFSKIRVINGTPSHWQFIDSKPMPEALNHGKNAWIASKATSHLMDTQCSKYKLNPRDCAKFITKFNFGSTSLRDHCKSYKSQCSQEQIDSPYRSIDGSCNHLSSEIVGRSFTSYTRLLFPHYLNGIYTIRRSVTKSILPSPRLISTSISKNKEVSEDRYTLALMEWGEFISDDLHHTATSTAIHSEIAIECCDQDGSDLSPRYIHPFCAPISIPFNDKFYSQHYVTCMPYVRSLPAFNSDCSFGPFEQMNQATHFLDGSQIYGSDLKSSGQLREFHGGLLKFTSDGQNSFLPKSQKLSKNCKSKDETGCFYSGNPKVNSQPLQTTMYTIWLREHNRIARELAAMNPDFDDEKLFQEARKIVIAEMQHITFSEWLPILLGNKMSANILNLSSNYEKIDPSISNSFATAAMRFLKSLMPLKITLYDEHRNVKGFLNLRETFYDSNLLEKKGMLDDLIRALSTQNSQKLDGNYVSDLTNHLFENNIFGFDVFSLDIQRGRDHGLPSYNSYRSLCGLPEVTEISEFSDVMSEDAINMLSSIYKSPYDVDLLVGGILENPEDNALLGSTFSCIVLEQMIRTKLGDRFFYSSLDQPVPFTKLQLSEIHKVSLARILCDNADDIKMLQPNVFHTLSSSNKLVKCTDSQIPKVDLSAWQEFPQ